MWEGKGSLASERVANTHEKPHKTPGKEGKCGSRTKNLFGNGRFYKTRGDDRRMAGSRKELRKDKKH